MITTSIRFAFCLALGLAALPAAAENTAPVGDPVAGEQKAIPCNACHGLDGLSINTLWPNLAGQKEVYLVKQLKEFRDGIRPDPIMQIQASALSDQDILDLAAHYHSLSGIPAPVPPPHS